jgi:hypothetical protein
MRSFWTKEEETFLIANYERSTQEIIMTGIPMRTWGAIRRHAQFFRLNRGNNVNGYWKERELILLKKLYPRADWKILLAAFPDRNRFNINEKASYLGIRRIIHTGREKTGKEMVCKNCHKIFYQPPSRTNRPFCSQVCSSEYLSGENAPNWQGGISFEPYPAEFNAPFRRMIRERDKYTCAVCGKFGKHVHHINYNKKDIDPSNCITLCITCHSKTNFNREYWQQYFTVIEFCF